jgi:hypothetical protein
MARIQERIYVRCPFGKAPSFLNYYLDELARQGRSEGSVLRLVVPVAELGLGIPGGTEIASDVVAHFVPVDDDTFGIQQTAVDWEPEGGGPFPKFAGFLTIETDEDYNTCSLLLEGAYEPPFGPVGVVFDAALGHRIATVTARELLKAVRRCIENEYFSSQRAETT